MGRWRRSYSRYDYGYSSYWPQQPTVAERQASAARETAKLAKKGETLSPVRIQGRTIARTFWGKAWCTNLEGYSDYSNRLPRGRSYLSSGQVLDLRVEKGKVTARVMGTRLYTVTVTIDPVAAARWSEIVRACAGQVGSMIELLQGKLSQSVMQTVTQPRTGLFPAPREIHLGCSCPDWASMCKHVAASLYGVGARLDEKPELLFVLRGVDPSELVVDSGAARAITSQAKDKALEADAAELADLFGIDMGSAGGVAPVAESGFQAVSDRAPVADGAPPKSGVRRRAVKAATNVVDTNTTRAKTKTSARKTANAPRASGKRPKATAEERTLVTQSELDAREIAPSITAYWAGEGLLVPGPKKGTWLASAECVRRIQRCVLKRPIRGRGLVRAAR